MFLLGIKNMDQLFFYLYDFHPNLQLFYPQLINISMDRHYVHSHDNIKIRTRNGIPVAGLESDTLYTRNDLEHKQLISSYRCTAALGRFYDLPLVSPISSKYSLMISCYFSSDKSGNQVE